MAKSRYSMDMTTIGITVHFAERRWGVQMSDLIDKQMAIEAIDNHIFYDDYDSMDKISLINAIRALPSVEKRGRWIDTGEIWTDMYTADEDPIYKCSVCNKEVIGGSMHFAYCPNCGARMEEKDEY